MGANSCSYGRVDELVYFASIKEQFEIVVHHYIQVLRAADFICGSLSLCVCALWLAYNHRFIFISYSFWKVFIYVFKLFNLLVKGLME